MAMNARKEIPPVLALVSNNDRNSMEKLVTADPWSAELAFNNPALFFLLLRACRESGLNTQELTTLAHLRRTELLTAIGCNSSVATERFLRRVCFNRLSVDDELALRALVERPLPAWAHHCRFPHLGLLTQIDFSHWQRASQAFDSVLQNDPCMTNRAGGQLVPDDLRRDWGEPLVRRVIQAIIEIIRLSEYGRSWMDLMETEHAQRRDAYYRRLARCRSLPELEELHQHMIAQESDQWSETTRLHLRNLPWPKPPLPGNADIRPIESLDALANESTAQKNCVLTYAERILGGEGYVYSVLSPERATLYVVPDERGFSRIEEIKLSHNRHVSDQTILMVDQWLRASTE